MQVTITNAHTEKVYVSMLWKSLDVGESAVVSRTSAQLEAEDQLNELIVAGYVTLAYEAEANDAGVTSPALLEVYTDTSRPDPADQPAGATIWNDDDNFPNTSDGTNWIDPTGAST